MDINETNEKNVMIFKINAMSFLHEIADCAMPKTMGVLKVPLNVFRIYLGQIAERALELKDPILDEIMCNMSLYEQADQYSDNYNREAMEMVSKIAAEYRINHKKI